MGLANSNTINDLKRRYVLEDVIAQYGVELKRKGADSLECLCPFHDDDKTPSLKVTPSKQLFHCFGCGTGGDVITWVEQYEKISRAEAIQRLSQETFVPFQKATPTSRPHVHKATVLKDVVRLYSTTFKKSKVAQNYLEGRGLSKKSLWNHYSIGYCNGSALKNILSDITQAQLKALGLLNEKGNESFYKCLIIPIKNDRNITVGLYGRSIDGNRHHYLKNGREGVRRGVFNAHAAKSHKSLIVTESIFDALSLIEMDYLNVICIWGTQGWSQDHQAFIENHNFEEIIFALDNDRAGLEATERLKEKVQSQVAQVSRVQLPESIKDLNDFICHGGERKDFETLLENRIILKAAQAPSQNKATSIVQPIEKTKEYITFQLDELTYQVRPMPSGPSVTLKVVLTVYREGKRFTDSLNLYAAKTRSILIHTISNHLEVQSAKVENDLYQIIAYLEQLRTQETQQSQASIPQMSSKEEQQAIQFLKSKNLIKNILQDIESIGYAGQSKEVLLLYTSFISVLSDAGQIHVSIQSSSSSGKSEMLLKVSSLLPPERVQLLSRMSSQSLYYGKNLDGTVLILDERSAADEQGQLALRSLMSRGQLTLNVVQRDPMTGQSRTESIHVSARCCVWDADTATTSEDNLNRAFQIYMDESTRQTEKIHRFQVDKFSSVNWSKAENLKAIKRKHHHAIRLLKPYKVEIPYSDKVQFPTYSMRSRRDFYRFLNLISCVALLHQYQRPILKTSEGIEYIQATLSDYEYAYKMIVGIVRDTYTPIQKESRDLFDLMLTQVLKLSKQNKVPACDYAFTRRDVREWSHWSEWKTRHSLKELVGFELLQRVSGKNGRQFKYRLLSTENEFKGGVDDLITPQALEEKLALESSLC